jgi:hypothetical protein
MGARCSGHLTEGTIAATQQVADVNRRRLARSLNRTPETRRASLSDEERLKLALAEIDRLRAELRLEQALGEIERAADDLRKLSC